MRCNTLWYICTKTYITTQNQPGQTSPDKPVGRLSTRENSFIIKPIISFINMYWKSHGAITGCAYRPEFINLTPPKEMCTSRRMVIAAVRPLLKQIRIKKNSYRTFLKTQPPQSWDSWDTCDSQITYSLHIHPQPFHLCPYLLANSLCQFHNDNPTIGNYLYFPPTILFEKKGPHP